MNTLRLVMMVWVMLFLLAVPALAAQNDETLPPLPIQSEPLPGVSDTTFTVVVIALAGVIIALVAAYAYSQNKSTAALYQSLPPEATNFMRMVLEYFSSKAALTPSALDDEALKALTMSLGYSWHQQTDGRVILTRVGVIDESRG